MSADGLIERQPGPRGPDPNRVSAEVEEEPVGEGPSLVLSTLSDIRYPCDIFPTGRLYTEDLAEPKVRREDPGMILAPDVPELGGQPNPDRLAKMIVQQASLR